MLKKEGHMLLLLPWFTKSCGAERGGRGGGERGRGIRDSSLRGLHLLMQKKYMLKRQVIRIHYQGTHAAALCLVLIPAAWLACPCHHRPHTSEVFTHTSMSGMPAAVVAAHSLLRLNLTPLCLHSHKCGSGVWEVRVDMH